MKKGDPDRMLTVLQKAMIRGGDYGGAVRYIESKGYTLPEFLQAVGFQGSVENMMTREATFGLSDRFRGATDAISEAWAGDRKDGEGFFDALKRHTRKYQVMQQFHDMQTGIADDAFSPLKTVAQLPTSLGLGLGLQRQVMRMPGFRTPFKSSAGAAGIEGVMYEAGTHPVESEQLVNAMLKQGGLNMAGGGLMAALGLGVTGIYNKLVSKTPKNIEGEAEERVFDALFSYEEDAVEDITQKRLAAQKEFPGVPIQNFDVSIAARDIAEAGSQQIGMSRKGMIEMLEDRQEGQFDRLVSFFDEGLGTRTDIVEASQKHVINASKEAKDLYKQIESEPVDDFSILTFMQKKSFRDAYTKAQMDQAARMSDGMSFIDMPGGYKKRLNAKGKPVRDAQGEEIMDWEDPPVYTIGQLDLVKQALDETLFSANRLRNAGQLDQRMQGTIGNLKQFRMNFVNRLDEFSDDYKTARNTFAGHMEMADAIEAGNKFLSLPTDRLRAVFKELKTDGARDAFRQAARAKLEERIGRLAPEANKAKILRTNDMMERFRIVYKDDADFERAGRYFKLESDMQKSSSRILANSVTQFRQELKEFFEGGPRDPDLAEMMLRGITNPGELYNRVQDMMRVAPSNVRDRIIGIILDDDRLANLSVNVGKRRATRKLREETLPGILAVGGGAGIRGTEMSEMGY